MKSIAVIPARGGSKRLSRKNVLPFHGKPMVLWTCEAARDSGVFDRILVSTEDEEIAGVVTAAGFSVDRRPQELATDTASCAQVCLELLDRLEARGDRFSILCCLYATAPLRSAQDITATMALLGDSRTNFAYAVTRYSMPPHQMLFEDQAGWLNRAWPLIASMKLQQLPEALIDNGSTYAARVPAFRQYRDFYGPQLRGYLMPQMRSIDIDTQEDYEMALWAAEWLRGRNNHDE